LRNKASRRRRHGCFSNRCQRSCVPSTLASVLSSNLRRHSHTRPPRTDPAHRLRNLSQHLCRSVGAACLRKWSLARYAACRPGALGSDVNRGNGNEFMTWRDAESKQGDEPGVLDLSVVFRHLRINTRDPEKAAQLRNKRSVRCYLKSSVAQHISVFPGHRLAVIAIRRKLFPDINIIEGLVDSNLQYLRVCHI
jgi:hypothetical protein